MIECMACDHIFDGTTFRWRCPECGFKASCCEGEPLCYPRK